MKKWTSLVLFWLLSLFQSVQAGEITFFHNDINGTPIMATNMSGAVVWSAQYAPYGERLSIKSSAGVETVSTSSAALENNAKWYVGKGYDEDTGLIYMGARYYDPRIGRFYGIDPKEVDEADVHSFNRYAYANNNPYRYVDPDGRNPLLVGVAGAMGVAALISGGGDALAQYIHKGSVDWKQAGRAALEGATEWPLVLVGGAGTSGRTAGVSGQARSAAQSAQLRSQLIGREIAGGHAFEKHVLQQKEFASLGIKTKEQFARHIENVVNNPSAQKSISRGRYAYWDDATGTVVIRDPKHPDGGNRF